MLELGMEDDEGAIKIYLYYHFKFDG